MTPRLAIVRPPPATGADARGIADGELVLRLARRDRSALEEVYSRYAGELFGVLVRLLGRTGEAEDALQETFVIAFEKAGQVREHGALRAWLFRVAVREAHSRLRRRKRWSFFGASSSAEDDAPLVDLVAEGASGDARAELALLDRELAKLPYEQRIAWMLRYVEGEALEDVADACGCSLATVKRWVAAADQAVRRHVRLEETEAGDG